MLVKPAALLALVLTVSLPFGAQSKRGPSTEEERAHALAFIADFEKNPLGPNAKDERQWVTLWLIEVPDIHAQACLIFDMPKGSKKDSDVIFSALMFGGARVAIEHKDEPVNPLAQFKAGVRSAVAVYELLLTAKAKDRDAVMDDLVTKRDAGTLDDFVTQQTAKKCTDSAKIETH